MHSTTHILHTEPIYMNEMTNRTLFGILMNAIGQCMYINRFHNRRNHKKRRLWFSVVSACFPFCDKDYNGIIKTKLKSCNQPSETEIYTYTESYFVVHMDSCHAHHAQQSRITHNVPRNTYDATRLYGLPAWVNSTCKYGLRTITWQSHGDRTL